MNRFNPQIMTRGMCKNMQKYAKCAEWHTLANQSINQSTGWSTNQSINQPINRSINQSTNQPINQSINRSVTDQSINQPISRLIDQSTNPPWKIGNQVALRSSGSYTIYHPHHQDIFWVMGISTVLVSYGCRLA